MSFVIEKDNKGKPPSFLTSFTDASIVWGALSSAQKFATEDEAQDVIDNHPLYGTEITEPEDETVFEGTSIKKVNVLSGMTIDTHQND
jgi:hypothetical protein